MSAPDRLPESPPYANHFTGIGRRRRSVASLCAWHAISAMALLSILTGSAAAQVDEGDPFAGVEEMIVVGGSAASLLAEAQTSAIAFDASDLENYRVQDVGDVAAYVPNLEIRTANATNASFFIRGVGLQDFGSNASSSVPIFQDGIARNPSASQLVGLFDISGLTVMKGPQGSGNYRNASAGAFVIKTQQPEPEFSGYAKVSYSKIYSVDAHDANKYDMEAAMNAPVYGDIVSMRISTRYQRETPWFENGCANRLDFTDRPFRGRRRDGGVSEDEASLCGENVRRAVPGVDPTPGRGYSEVTPFLSKYLGEIDDFGFRGQVRIQPPDSGMDFVARLEISRLNRDSTLGQVFGTGAVTNPIGGEDLFGYRDPDIEARLDEYTAIVRAAAAPEFLGRAEAERRALPFVAKELYKTPLDRKPFRGDFDRPGRLILETWAASVTGKIELDESLLELNAGYVDYRKSESRDTDLSPNRLFPSSTNDQAWEVYGAAELSGDTLFDHPLNWKTGVYNMWQKVEAFQRQFIFEDEAFNDFEEQLWSWGVFGEVEYEFLEGFTLGAGARYNWERKDFRVQENTVTGSFGNAGPDVGVALELGSQNQRTWEQWTGFAKIAYRFTEDIEAWVKYTRGFKAGHFNPSRAQAAKDPAVGYADPEQIDAWELGSNFALWEGRISGNAALFYYNYRNYQVFRLTRTTTVFRTIESARLARNYGADFEFVISPLEGFVPEMIEGLRITFNGGWLETNYVEFSTLEVRNQGDAQIGVAINYSGNPLISAPNLSFTGTVIWPIVTNTFGTITPQYDFTWNDDTPFDPNNGRGELTPFGDSRFQNYLIGNRAYILHNVRLAWDPPGESGVTIAGWCRNLEDKRYKNFGVDLAGFTGAQLIFVGDPRTCGVDARFNF